MADREWDIIVVGAGSNGLVLAGELAARGAKVLALEARPEAGGLLTAEECSLPGYWHNLLGAVLNPLDRTPPYQALGLEQEGARFLVPPVQVALPTRDQRAVVFADDAELSRRSIAAFSELDGQTYRELRADLLPIFQHDVIPQMYSPPSPMAGPIHPDLQRYGPQSPRDIAEGFFESPPLQAAVLHQLLVPWGVLPDYRGHGSATLRALSGAAPFAVAAGSARRTAQALVRALVRQGGEYRVEQTVGRILVEPGEGGAAGAWRAVGVALADGTQLRARAVASSGGLRQTLLDLVGQEALGPSLAAQVSAFRLDEYALFAVHLALAQPPHYPCEDTHTVGAAVDRALRVLIGVESPAEIDALWREIRAGTLPEPRGMVVTVPTLFDPSQAPPDRHTAVLLQPVPPAPGGSPERWDALRDEYAARCVANWRRYATNLRDEDILAAVALTPRDVAARYPNYAQGALGMGAMTVDQAGPNRPLPELSQYKTPIDGLYLCGYAMHPGPGWLGAPGHNAAQVLAQDLGLS